MFRFIILFLSLSFHSLAFEISVPTSFIALQPTWVNWTINHVTDAPNITIALLDQSKVPDCATALERNVTTLTKERVGPNRAPVLSESPRVQFIADKPGTYFICALSMPPSQPGQVVYQSPNIPSLFAQTMISSQTVASTPTSSPSDSSDNVNQSNTSNSSISNAAIGGIVGGICGILAILAASTFLFMRYRRRKRIAGTFSKYTVDPYLASNKMAKERMRNKTRDPEQGEREREPDVVDLPPSYASAL